MRPWPLIYLFAPLVLTSTALLAGEPTPAEPQTTDERSIPLDELELLLKPLTKGQLIVEASAWQQIVQRKAEQIVAGEIAVKRQNAEIDEAEAIREQAEQAKRKFLEVEKQAAEAAASGDAEVRELAEDAKAKVLKVQAHIDAASDAAERTAKIRERIAEANSEGMEETADAAASAADQVEQMTTAIDTAAAIVQDDGDVAEATSQARQQGDDVDVATAIELVNNAAEQAATAAAQAQMDTATGALPDLLDHAVQLAATEEVKRQEKRALLETVTAMRDERKQLIDRLKAVLTALEIKTPDDDSETLALVADHRLYIRAVSGVEVDVQDTTSAWIAIKGWAASEEGGMRLVLNLLRFFGVLIAAWFIAKLLSAAVHRGLKRVRGTSKLLEDFFVKTIRWAVMGIGIIMALAALEISVGPLLAIVGAAGFVVAFALQDSLSNFASGLMILIFRPFDVGDVVDAGGVSGKVASMNLISTTITTFDNKTMVVPNNKIFGEVITNATGVGERRIDMEFGIAYDADIDQAQAILEEIIGSHPKVLENPEPTIALHTLGDSSVNFIVRPWSRTADYWDVYWDVTKAVKKRFDAAGIGIPFPQRDVHVHFEGNLERLPNGAAGFA
jgi:small conductance mechanosensitive channel